MILSKSQCWHKPSHLSVLGDMTSEVFGQYQQKVNVEHPELCSWFIAMTEVFSNGNK